MLLLKGKILVLSCFMIFCNSVFTQQYTQFSNYLLNSSNVNPAYTGSKPGLELMATYRRQWRAIEGTPQTYSISGHSLVKNSKIGVGGLILKDEIGVSDNLYITASTSYSLTLNRFKLNFGLNGGLQAHKMDFDKITTIEEGDEVFSGSSSYRYSPTIGAGLYLFSDDFYIGLSSPDLLESNNKLEQGTYRKKRHFYFSVGKVFTISNNVNLKPSLLGKITSGSELQLDLSGTIILYKLVGVGLSYRTQAGMVWYTQIFINRHWTFAYAFDDMTNNLSGIEGGTHEVTLIHNFHKKQETIYSPRYF